MMAIGGDLLNLVRADRVDIGERVNGRIVNNRFVPWNIERIVRGVASNGRICSIVWAGRPGETIFDVETWLNVVLDEPAELSIGEITREMEGS